MIKIFLIFINLLTINFSEAGANDIAYDMIDGQKKASFKFNLTRGCQVLATAAIFEFQDSFWETQKW